VTAKPLIEERNYRGLIFRIPHLSCISCAEQDFIEFKTISDSLGIPISIATPNRTYEIIEAFKKNTFFTGNVFFVDTIIWELDSLRINYIFYFQNGICTNFFLPSIRSKEIGRKYFQILRSRYK
jgi:hypothetical protein